MVTGAGGAGTTSVAAALAQRTAAEGRRTLLLGRESIEVSDAPENLEVRAVQPLAWAEATWDSLALPRRLVGGPWASLGNYNIIPVPGLDALAWWGTVREAWRGRHDVLVIDAGPVATAQAWLTLPDTLVGLLRRTWTLPQRTAEAAGQLQDGSWHLRALARLDSEAAELAAGLRSATTSIQLVATPQVHDLRRALDSLAPLAMFELNITDLVVNRITRKQRDPMVAARLAEQLPWLTVRRALDHRHGTGPALGRELYPDLPTASRPLRPTVGGGAGEYVWTRTLPLAHPDQVTTVVDGEDLILTLGNARRVIPMPSVLRRCTMVSAVLQDQALRLTFIPNPDVWPKSGVLTEDDS